MGHTENTPSLPERETAILDEAPCGMGSYALWAVASLMGWSRVGGVLMLTNSQGGCAGQTEAITTRGNELVH